LSKKVNIAHSQQKNKITTTTTTNNNKATNTSKLNKMKCLKQWENLNDKKLSTYQAYKRIQQCSNEKVSCIVQSNKQNNSSDLFLKLLHSDK
jgi:outer membrane phospholipase A